MPCNQDFIDYVCEQVRESGTVRWRKMFGEYMIYVNDKPLFLVCDDTVYIKMKEEVKDLLREAETGYPYPGAKEHYLLDVDDKPLCLRVARLLEAVTAVPKPKKDKKHPDSKKDPH